MDSPRVDAAPPSPDDLCVCGHPRHEHTQAGHFAPCMHRRVPAWIDQFGFCSCNGFKDPVGGEG